jgi:broad specificity phosphatase PhoE
MNLHLTSRPIYFSRHGESEYNIDDRIGGDPDLTQRGYAYAAKLNTFFKAELKANRINKKTKFFTSTLRRAVITSKHVKVGIDPVQLKVLDEINPGICDGLTYKELDEKFPMDASERKTDKLRYRYPRGESYLDLIQRLEPVLFEIERSREPVIVVSQAKMK